MPNYDYTFKILLFGDSSVGKVAFTKRYCYNIFNPSERLTIGVDFHVKTTVLKGKKIKLQIWDVGGEERFRFLLSTYCLGANAAFILYDITRPATLDNVNEWSNTIRKKAGNIPIMLIGTNVDLQTEQRKIPREYGIKIAEKNKLASFGEISAKTGQNVNESFNVLTELALERLCKDTNTSKLNEKIIKQDYIKFMLELDDIPIDLEGITEINEYIDALNDSFMEWRAASLSESRSEDIINEETRSEERTDNTILKIKEKFRNLFRFRGRSPNN